MQLPLETIQDAIDNNHGYCRTCKEIHEQFAEPDAIDITCESCAEPTLMGVEMAIMCGNLGVGE